MQCTGPFISSQVEEVVLLHLRSLLNHKSPFVIVKAWDVLEILIVDFVGLPTVHAAFLVSLISVRNARGEQTLGALVDLVEQGSAGIYLASQILLLGTSLDNTVTL